MSTLRKESNINQTLLAEYLEVDQSFISKIEKNERQPSTDLIESKRYFTIGKYIKLAEQLMDNGLISDGKYEELLMSAFRSDIVFGSECEEGEVYD